MNKSEKAALVAALKPAVEWVKTQIKRDRSNRYALLHDWQLPATFCSFWPADLPDWDSERFRIHRVSDGVIVITVRAYPGESGICDGATLAPDTPPGVLPAALFHDPWYYHREFEAIAAFIGVPARRLRKFGDAIFYSIHRAAGGSWLLAHVYHIGIRIGFPLVKPFLLALVIAGLSSGCSGCIAPGDDGTFLDPADFDPPAWEKVQ